jgi:hypothetical protein
MAKIFEITLEKLLAPLLVLLLTPAVTALASKLQTGSWSAWFAVIPRLVYYIVAAIFLLWVLIVLLRRRARHIRHMNDPVVRPIFIPQFGYVQVGELTHAGVRWRFLAPAPAPWDRFEPRSVAASSITVETPPRCPKCDTELEEQARFLGGAVSASTSSRVTTARRYERRDWRRVTGTTNLADDHEA